MAFCLSVERFMGTSMLLNIMVHYEFKVRFYVYLFDVALAKGSRKFQPVVDDRHLQLFCKAGQKILVVTRFQIFVQFLFCHRQLARIMVQPIQEVFSDLLRPLAVDLPGQVFLFAQALVTKFIPQLGDLGRKHHGIQEMGRNEDDAVFVGQHGIPGQYDGPADADGGVDGSQHHILDIGRVYSFYPAVESADLAKAGFVADAAVKDDPAVRPGIDGVAQVVPDEGALGHFQIPIRDIDIPFGKYIDGPGVGATLLVAAFCLALFLYRVDEVGTGRHILVGDDTTGHRAAVGVDDMPVAFILVIITVVAEDVPDVFQGNLLQALQHDVGYPGPPVRKTFALPAGSQGLDVLRGRTDALCASDNDKTKQNETSD